MTSVMTGISRRTFVTATGLAAAGAVLSACDSGKEKSSPNTSSKKQADKVTYLTGFGILGRESYVHVAVSKGFFKDVGLDVTIQPGQAGLYNHNQVLAGQAQFAAVDPSGALIRQAKADKPEDKNLRIIAAAHQLTLNALVAWADKGIGSPRDLAGKTLGVATGAVPKTLFPAYARLAGIDDKSVKWSETAPPQLPSLLVTNKVDAVATFNVAVPGIEKAAGNRKTAIFPYSDVLSDLYGTVIITHLDITKKNPDLAKRFTGALMKGLRYAVEHPDEAGKILNQMDNTQNADLAAKELTLLKPYTIPPGGAPVGTFDESRMAKNIAVLQGLGLMPTGLTPDQAVDTRFIPKSDS
jgi:NitT/TauT family transport system substrate-binding protein